MPERQGQEVLWRPDAQKSLIDKEFIC